MRLSRKTTSVVTSLLLLSSFLIQGCGQNEAIENSAGSFSGVTSAVTSAVTATETATSTTKTNLATSSEVKDQDITDQDRDQEKTLQLPDKVETEATEVVEPTEAIEQTEQTEPKEVVKATKTKQTVSKQEAKVEKTNPSSQSINVNDSQKNDGSKDSITSAESEPSSNSAPIQKLNQNAKGVTSISWSGFFDGEDQTTPSDQFWDLSGSTVKIKGFMGEVLSFEKNWFLLIPEPGAECPFDNGDETYWNKIMIVFVPEDIKLRYKSEAIEITGRLDVGIKVDESGYKTMFRLYDATFKEIKE